MPRNNSYFIAITIPEPLSSVIERMKQEICVEYGTKSVLKSPSHITIVPPFFWGNEESLLDMIQKFSFQSFTIKLNGFGAFPLGVVYIDIEENDQLNELHRKFNEAFYKDYPSLKKKLPFEFHPHITVGNRDWKWVQFNRCWNEMKDTEFVAEIEFSQLTLLKNINGLWVSLPSG